MSHVPFAIKTTLHYNYMFNECVIHLTDFPVDLIAGFKFIALFFQNTFYRTDGIFNNIQVLRAGFTFMC